MGGFPSCANSALSYSSTPPFAVLLIAPDSAHFLEYLEPSWFLPISSECPSPTSSQSSYFFLYFPTSDLTFPGKPRANTVFHPRLHSFDFLGELTSFKFSGLRSYQLLPRCLSPPVWCKLREGGAPSRSFQYYKELHARLRVEQVPDTWLWNWLIKRKNIIPTMKDGSKNKRPWEQGAIHLCMISTSHNGAS